MVSAIVMAAGLSTRTGLNNKLLLPFRKKTIIETTINNIIDTGIDEIIVVLGNEAEKVRQKIENLPIRLSFNEEYKSGLTSSIKHGVALAKGNGFLLCLADMVLVSKEDYLNIINAFKERIKDDQYCICIPEYNGQKGNPVLFSAAYKETIMAHNEMNGCKGVVRANNQHIWEVKMVNDHVLIDIDTIDDYNKLTCEV